MDELEKAAQTPKKTAVELQKDVVQRHWKSYTIRDALWHVRDTWKQVTESCIRRVWKKLNLHLAVDFRDFDLAEMLSKERLLSPSNWRGRSVSTRLKTTTSTLCWSQSARSCRWRSSTNWRSSGVSWRRRWRQSSILRHQ